jgi:hypothetical protein
MYPLNIEILTNFQHKIQKDFWKQGPILTFQKFIIAIWLKFHKKTFSHLPLWFHSSTHV